MRTLIAIALLASCLDGPRHYECVSTSTCGEAPPYVYEYSRCVTEDEMRAEVERWMYLCDELTGFYACDPWSCGERCVDRGPCP